MQPKRRCTAAQAVTPSGMVGTYFPTQLDGNVMDPLKHVLKKDLNEVFTKSLATPGPLPPAPPASARGGAPAPAF